MGEDLGCELESGSSDSIRLGILPPLGQREHVITQLTQSVDEWPYTANGISRQYAIVYNSRIFGSTLNFWNASAD